MERILARHIGVGAWTGRFDSVGGKLRAGQGHGDAVRRRARATNRSLFLRVAFDFSYGWFQGTNATLVEIVYVVFALFFLNFLSKETVFRKNALSRICGTTRGAFGTLLRRRFRKRRRSAILSLFRENSGGDVGADDRTLRLAPSPQRFLLSDVEEYCRVHFPRQRKESAARRR